MVKVVLTGNKAAGPKDLKVDKIKQHCGCDDPDAMVIHIESNMWFWSCYVQCDSCGLMTKDFDHKNKEGLNDQSSGTPKAVEAWNNKEFDNMDTYFLNHTKTDS